MAAFDFDLFVIGGGSGGVRAARVAAQRGGRVALAEQGGTQGLGGTCVNVGCIPKKLYSYAAHYAEAVEESHGFGWEGEPLTLNWQTLKANRRHEISRLNGVYQTLLTGSGVRVLNAHARLAGPHEVVADGKSWSAKTILVATGGTPHVPEIEGRELVSTSNDMFDLEPFPSVGQRMAVYRHEALPLALAAVHDCLRQAPSIERIAAPGQVRLRPSGRGQKPVRQLQ